MKLTHSGPMAICLLVLSSCGHRHYPGNMAEVINAYRVDEGLPRVPVSPRLNLVAETHVRDLEAHAPVEPCNMHSWSSDGAWKSCCYTPDHAAASCMWDKPREIAGYAGEGYEIAAGAAGVSIDENDALDVWRDSPAHHEVILNRGIWADRTWRAMGAARSAHYAVVWFAEEPP